MQISEIDGKKKRDKSFNKANGAHVKTILGLFIILLSLVGFYFWETIGEKTVNYKTILVFNQDIEESTVIKSGMLEAVKVPADVLVSGVLTKEDSIIGKEATTFIPKGMQLVSEFFEESELLVGKGSFVMSIPSEWLLNSPQTLRRGDTIYFYPVNTSEAGRYFEEEITPSKCLTSAVVSSARDSSNREVVDTSAVSRQDGSANMSGIEVIVTEAQYESLYESYMLGNTFLIMYK